MTIALISLLCMLTGAGLGVFMHRLLPEEHLNSDSKDVIKLGAALLATQAALVLGLLVSEANSSFDAMNAGLTEAGAKFILLDHALSRYGPETQDLREQLQRTLASSVEQIWPKNKIEVGGVGAVEASTGWEKAGDVLRELNPQGESQRLLKAQALQITGELTQLRWLLIQQTHSSIPTVFVVVLVFWFTVLFATFGLLTPINATVNTVMLLCALSVAGGILQILDMNQPLDGIIKASSAPLDNALKHVGE